MFSFQISTCSDKCVNTNDFYTDLNPVILATWRSLVASIVQNQLAYSLLAKTNIPLETQVFQ